MEYLTQSTLFLRKVENFTKFSVNDNGYWDFSTLSNPERVANGLSFFKITSIFGILDENAEDPSKPAYYGNIGDYVVRNGSGSLAIMTQKQYIDRFIPTTLDIKRQALNSEELKNPGFITKLLRGSSPSVSNRGTMTSMNASRPQPRSGGSSGCSCSK